MIATFQVPPSPAKCCGRPATEHGGRENITPVSTPIFAASITSPVSLEEPSISGIQTVEPPEKANRFRAGEPTTTGLSTERSSRTIYRKRASTRRMISRTGRWIGFGKSRMGINHFFLYLAYNAPHWPLHAHPEDIEKYHGVYDGGYESIRKQRYQRQLETGLFASDSVPLSPPEHDDWDSLSSEEKADQALRMQVHAAMVDRVDQNVGRLLNQLEKNGQLNNTLIFFLVDNGASHENPTKRGPRDPDAPMGSVGSFESIGQSWANAVNAPLRKWKVQGLEGGICTPMIAHWPNGITTSANEICREPCHLIDLLPTLMELAGDQVSYPDDIPAVDGVSLVPLLKGKRLRRTAPLFFQYGAWQAIRDNQWKLVQYKNNPWELYDLRHDRTETQNLASQQPGRVAEMTRRWQSWYRDCTGEAWKTDSRK